ncbi:MAG: hypothetical protein ABMA00_17780 [Gemmatimonas sp.]
MTFESLATKVRAIVGIILAHDNVTLMSDKVALANQREEIFQKCEALLADNGRLKSRVAELEQQVKMKELMVPDKQVYWTGAERRPGKDGPWCPRCWHENGLQMRMQTFEGGTDAYCPKCKTNVQVWPELYRPPDDGYEDL